MRRFRLPSKRTGCLRSPRPMYTRSAVASPRPIFYHLPAFPAHILAGSALRRDANQNHRLANSTLLSRHGGRSMGSIRPLITIAILGGAGVYLFIEINKGPAPSRAAASSASQAPEGI